LTLSTDIFRRYVTESSEIFTAHATITNGLAIGELPLEIQTNKYVGKVLAGKKNYALSPSVIPLVFGFFISDKSSDGKRNYRRSIFRQTNHVGDAVGKNITDEFSILHRRN
jgi:hypothetical protein